MDVIIIMSHTNINLLNNLACISYHDFLDRGLLLTRKLLNQGLQMVKLKLSLRKFYGRNHELVDHYGSLRNNRFPDDIGYVTYVVTTMPFPFSRM